MRKYALLTSILLIAVLASVSIASAMPAPLTYDVTNNYEGINTPIGATVVVTATTTDTNVDSVVFVFYDPSGLLENTRVSAPIAVVWNEGVGVAQAEVIPDSLGGWIVLAMWAGPSGTLSFFDVNNVISYSVTTFLVVAGNVVPEVPILGTAGIAGAMAIGLAVKAKRKNIAI